MTSKSELLEKIAALLCEYEDPTGHNCSNDTGAEILLDAGKERYVWKRRENKMLYIS